MTEEPDNGDGRAGCMICLLSLACSFRPPAPPITLDLAPIADGALSTCTPQVGGVLPLGGVIEVPMPLNSMSGLPTVVVEVNGKPFTMLIDTGSATNVVTDEVADRLGLSVQGTMSLGTAGGEVMVREASASFRIGGVVFEDEHVAVIGREHLSSTFLGFSLVKFDGIVGWPILASGRATLNYDRQTFRLEPSTGTPQGMNLVWEGAPCRRRARGGAPVRPTFRSDVLEAR